MDYWLALNMYPDNFPAHPRYRAAGTLQVNAKCVCSIARAAFFLSPPLRSPQCRFQWQASICRNYYVYLPHSLKSAHPDDFDLDDAGPPCSLLSDSNQHRHARSRMCQRFRDTHTLSSFPSFNDLTESRSHAITRSVAAKVDHFYITYLYNIFFHSNKI